MYSIIDQTAQEVLNTHMRLTPVCRTGGSSWGCQCCGKKKSDGKRKKDLRDARDGIKPFLRNSNDEISISVGLATSAQASYRKNLNFFFKKVGTQDEEFDLLSKKVPSPPVKGPLSELGGCEAGGVVEVVAGGGGCC